MGLTCCQNMSLYVSETTVTEELVLTATQIEKYTNYYIGVYIQR